MQAPEPLQQHHWLLKLVGDWTYDSEALMEPGQPPAKFSGTQSVRALGSLWTLSEGGFGDMRSVITLGFDPAKNRFVGTFVASVMNYLWIYDGELDATETTLSLYADGPSFSDPAKTAKYRDAIELKNDDHHVFTGSLLGDDGNWICFMTAHYHRVK